MYESNDELITARLAPADIVLDIGGWARPFNRANYVMDAEPYETRGYYGEPQGGEREYFNEGTWIQRDICEHTPYPFRDKEIDFVICSHTLEDVRDPLWVCSEMVRVAKAGYIEVPSRVAESCRGIEPNQVGWSHHRWLIDIENNAVSFLMKYHMIHSHWRFSLPASYQRQLSERVRVQWLFWEGGFDFHERTIHGVDSIAHELEAFVQNTHPYSTLRLKLDAGYRSMRDVGRRIENKARRVQEQRRGH
jgi:hypothetical protein